ncbi:MAG: M10 family metallopeptidase [Pseudomonadota bacterium]
MPSYLTGSTVVGYTVSPDYRIAALQGTFINGAPQVWLDVNMTYSFPNGSSSFANGQNYGNGEISAGWVPLSAVQQEAARKALTAWSNVSALKFTEVPDGNTVGDIRFGFSSAVQGTILGQGYYPTNNSATAGDVWLNAKLTQQAFTSGKVLHTAPNPADVHSPTAAANYYVLLHEIGHALGLSHSFAKTGETRGTATLPSTEDSYFKTIMSYNAGSDLYGGTPTTPMPYDILAIQHLYGRDFYHNSGNDTYTYDVNDVNFETIWDTGGTDTLVVTNKTNATAFSSVYIDLREGMASGIGFASFAASTYGQTINNAIHLTYRGSGQVAVAYHVTIENVVSSDMHDNITGNDANNRISSGDGNDIINGGMGLDTSVYARARADYALSKTGTGFTVTNNYLTAVQGGGTYQADTLTNIERLSFQNVKVALDISGNAGKAAKILGAVFGKETLSNKDYVGTAISLLDSGMSYRNLIDAALNVRLGANADSAAVVNLLFTNIVGAPAGAADLALYTGLLNSGALARADLAVSAADHAVNQTNINLVGLASSGIEYI